MNNIVQNLRNSRENLPRQQKLLCDYICNHVLEAGMLTIAELSEQAGVGTATVTRMLYSLGYTSYNQFKSDLREQAIQMANSSYDAFWNIHQTYNGNSSVEQDIFESAAQIQALSQPLYIYQLQNAAKMILAARKIYVVGLRSASSVSDFLAHSLLETNLDARSLSDEPDYVYDRLLDLNSSDLLIAIAARPLVKTTANALKICHKRGVPTLLILTAGSHDPLEDYASQTLLVQMDRKVPISTPIFLSVELLTREVNRRAAEGGQIYYKNLQELLDENGLSIWDQTLDTP